jgi:hypothetical protein
MLWLGQVVSMFGNWFNLIASAALIATLTDSGFAVGGLFMVRMLAPFTGSSFRARDVAKLLSLPEKADERGEVLDRMPVRGGALLRPTHSRYASKNVPDERGAEASASRVAMISSYCFHAAFRSGPRLI